MIRKKTCKINSLETGLFTASNVLLIVSWRVLKWIEKLPSSASPERGQRQKLTSLSSLSVPVTDSLSLREIFNFLVAFSTLKHQLTEEFLSNVTYSISLAVFKCWDVPSGRKERNVIYISHLEVHLHLKNLLSGYGNIKTLCMVWRVYISVPVTTNS